MHLNSTVLVVRSVAPIVSGAFSLIATVPTSTSEAPSLPPPPDPVLSSSLLLSFVFSFPLSSLLPPSFVLSSLFPL